MEYTSDQNTSADMGDQYSVGGTTQQNTGNSTTSVYDQNGNFDEQLLVCLNKCVPRNSQTVLSMGSTGDDMRFDMTVTTDFESLTCAYTCLSEQQNS